MKTRKQMVGRASARAVSHIYPPFSFGIITFCGAGVPPAIFVFVTPAQNRRRDAGATKTADFPQ